MNEDSDSDTLDDWRNGPAKRWYDMIGLSEDCQQYDYGFKLKTQSVSTSQSIDSRNDSSDAFNLVSQISWEKNVIWDSAVVKQRILKTLEKPSIAGWIPIDEKRTAPEFFKQINDNIIEKLVGNDVVTVEPTQSGNKSKCDDRSEDKTKNRLSRDLRKRKVRFSDDNENTAKRTNNTSKVNDMFKWVSTLPQENRDLILNCWEDDIIWDPEAMPRIPQPKIIPFSGDDDNAIIEWNDFEEESNDSNSNSMVNNLRHLSLNISDDVYYTSVNRADNSLTHSLVITHSFPANKLHSLCFPFWDPNFFRPLLKKSRKLRPRLEYEVLFCDPKMACIPSDAQNPKDLSKYLIKSIGELTARNGQIILTEYSEESPPLLMRTGMGSQLLNYFNVIIIIIINF